MALRAVRKNLSDGGLCQCINSTPTVDGGRCLLGNWGEALGTLRTADEQRQIAGLTQILTLRAEQKNPALIEGAVVLDVDVTEDSGNYRFRVTLHSADTLQSPDLFHIPNRSCDQYINWWEILSEDVETLIHQEFMTSIHEDESSFSSTSSPLQLEPDQVFLIRAHQNTSRTKRDELTGAEKSVSGYAAEQAFKGSIAKGFKTVRIPESLGKGLAQENPQPLVCDNP